MYVVHGTRKVMVSRYEVAAFNRGWPCSELRSTRSYWFEFDTNGDLIDTDCPEQDDGAAASAVADDCRKYIMEGEAPDWASCTTD